MAGPKFYAGMLDVGAAGAEPDWERVAKAVDLMRASGVQMVAAPAVRRADGGINLPFFALGNKMAALMGSDADPKGLIEAISPYSLAAYTKVDPKTASGYTLNALARLSIDDVREAPTKARDLLPRTTRDLEKPAEAFEGLVGLSRQREILEKVGTLVAKRGRGAVDCLHMAFIGNPGTGKTELARRLLAYLDAAGVTDGSGTFVKASAADLVGLYVGHTPAKTRAVVERAYGGLLFIDEVYTLLSANDYGQEAIDTLAEMLEEDRDRLVCVVAGYPDEIEALFKRNPGLRDRFGFRVAFDDYSTDELCAIFYLLAAERGIAVESSARAELERCLATMRTMRDFANARSARRLLDRAALEAAWRSDGVSISAEDVRTAFEQPDMGGSPRAASVGFVR